MKKVQAKARELLSELDSACLEVVLVPNRNPDSYGNNYRRLRAKQSENAEWYRLFCKQFASARRDAWRWSKHKTLIKRRDTRRGLLELIAGRVESGYAKRLEYFIERYCQ